MGDPRGQFADRRQALLQAQLLLEILDRRQIGEQADGAVRLTVEIDHRRNADAQMGLMLPRGRQDHFPSDDRGAVPQAFIDDVHQRLLAR